MKGGEHRLNLLASPCGTLSRHAGRQSRRNGGEVLVEIGAFGQEHVEVINAAETIERQLRGGDVHQDEVAVEHTRRPFVLQDAAHDKRQHAIANHQPQLAAQRVVAPRGELFGDDDRLRTGQDLKEFLSVEIARPVRLLARWPVGLLYFQQVVITKRLIAQDVDAQHLHRLHLAA